MIAKTKEIELGEAGGGGEGVLGARGGFFSYALVSYCAFVAQLLKFRSRVVSTRKGDFQMETYEKEIDGKS